VATTLKIRRSTGSLAPSTLEYGELAYSSGSGKFYFGSSTDGSAVDIVEIGGKAYVDLLSGITAGTVSASKSVIVDSNKSVSGFNTVGLSSAAFAGSTSGTSTLSAQAEAGTTAFVLPSTSGTLVGTGDTGTVSNVMLANSSITVNSKSVSLGGSVTLSTDDVAEGSTNQYFTTARARASVSVNEQDVLTYNSETGVFTFTASNLVPTLSVVNVDPGYGELSYSNGVLMFTKVTNDDIRSAISAGTGVTITSGQIAIGQAVGTADNVTFGSVTTTGDVTVGGTLNSNDITASTVTVTGDAVITGNLTVQGTTTTVNSTAVAISDVNLTLAKDATTSAQANGAGLTVAGAGATITYTSSTDSWDFNKQVVANVTGDLTGNADTATALETARDFSITGDVSATAVSFDGTGNVVLSTALGAGVVDTAELADNAVTSAKMATGSVELDTDTVTGVLPVANGGTGASTLESGKLLIGSGTSAVTTDTNLSWDSSTDTLIAGGASLATANDGTVTLSTTTANADIIIAPNGTGSVTIATNSIIFDSTGSGVVESAAGDSMTVRGDTELLLESSTGDISMVLPESDASKVTIVGPTPAQYATNITDNDLVTKYWVQNEALDGGQY
jgi:hypothetical protein